MNFKKFEVEQMIATLQRAIVTGVQKYKANPTECPTGELSLRFMQEIIDRLREGQTNAGQGEIGLIGYQDWSSGKPTLTPGSRL